MKESNPAILKKFKISENKSVITTQILFIERCINLLKEEGTMAILLPNNVFNGSESKDIREFVEDNGFIVSTVTLPRETFLSSSADINCSLLFFRKFTQSQKESWEELLKNCKQSVRRNQELERADIENILQSQVNRKEIQDKEVLAKAIEELKNQKKKATNQLKELDNQVEIEGRKMAKATFDYSIFMFEADFSGITATGETSEKNDLLLALEDYKNYSQNKPLLHSKSVIVPFSNLTRWDAKSYLYKLTSSFPLVKLGNYIYEHAEKIKLFDFPDTEFPILGVTNREGVYLNITEKGETFNQPYKKVKSGELAYNPYRVNVGSIGLIEQEYDGYFISPAYIVFGVKEEKQYELLKEYLYLVLSSDWYNPILRAATSGSVRQNLTFDLLSELEIPLPNLEKQQAIVNEWLSLKEQEKKLRATIDSFKNNLSNTLIVH